MTTACFRTQKFGKNVIPSATYLFTHSLRTCSNPPTHEVVH